MVRNDDPRLRKGTLAYDVGQNPSKPVVVTDPDKGTINDQEPALREIIVNNDANNALPMHGDTTCVEVAYVGLSASEKTYTMPETRVAKPQAEVDVGDYSVEPGMLALYSVVRELLVEAARSGMDTARLVSMLESAGVPDEFISAPTVEDISNPAEDG